jgi:RHS repeat-associated protein
VHESRGQVRDTSTNPPYYYFSDHLGSTSAITNSTGAIQNDSDYFPYGGEILYQSSVLQSYKFNAKERDTESGLDDFGARYYGNAFGRFVTVDWAAKPTAVPYANYGNPQSLNLFSYVNNNPTTTGDPDGHAGDPAQAPPPDCYTKQTGAACGGPNADSSAATVQAQNKSQDATTAAATTITSGTVATGPSTMEHIDQVVKPLIDSVEAGAGKAGNVLLDLGADVLGTAAVVLTLSQKTADEAHDTIQPVPESAHKTGERESTREKHEAGEARRNKDRGGEKGDARRRPPRKPPNGWKGPWPPKEDQNWW